MKSLEFLVGKDVDIFNPNDTEQVDGLMATGRVLSIADGWIVLTGPRGNEPSLAVNLAHVGMIAAREEVPQMEALPGGKVHRLHRPDTDDEDR